jgi:hypothetical protein
MGIKIPPSSVIISSSILTAITGDQRAVTAAEGGQGGAKEGRISVSPLSMNFFRTRAAD